MQDLLKWKHSQSWGLLLSGCLLGMTHTPEPMALPFHKLFFSRAKFLLFTWQPALPFHKVCSLWCSIALTRPNGFSGGSELGTSSSSSTLHPEGVPEFLVNFTSRPKGFQSFLSALCSAECFVITSYKIEHANLATFLPSVLHWQDIFLSCKDQLGNSPDARFALLGGPAVSPGLSLIHSLF